MRCAVKNCNNNNNSKSKPCTISFFNFPSDPAILKQWTSFCDRDSKMNVKTSQICMEHFKPEDFENNLQFRMGFTKRRFLKHGAVPSVPKVSFADEECYKDSVQRIQQLENKKIVEMLMREHDAKSGLVDDTKNEPSVQPIEIEFSVERQIHPESEVLSERQKKIFYKNHYGIGCLKKELQRLRKENSDLKNTSRKKACELKALEEKREKESKMYEYNLDVLTTRLTKAHYELYNLGEKLLDICTKGQIAILKAGVKRKKWTEEGITQAITLYAASAQLYKLLHRKHFPLPALRTLQAWCQKVLITPGLLDPVFKLLSASTHMTEIDKICVLSFNKAKIRKTYCYDKTRDTTLAPVNYVQVVMIRGLIAKWMQPIFYKYDCKMTANILHNILSKLKSCDYTVAAIVSDLESSDRALFNELKVTEEKPWFVFNGEKVFVFADVPHMIKLLRNHFVDEGFLINGKPVRADIISKLLDITPVDITIAHKISQTNLNVTNTKRQKVQLATNLFSDTVAKAITRAASEGELEGLNWEECHRMFKLINDWFDVMNVKVPFSDVRERCHAYGLSLETQNHILYKMTEMIKEMRIIGRKTMVPFQKGIIQSNNAIKGLHEDMMLRYNLKFILTYRLNQEVLEKFFGVIHAKGSLHYYPDQLEFNHRLRSFILGRNDGIIADGRNIEDDDTPDLEKSEKSLTGKIIGVLNVDVNTEEPVEQELTDMHYGGLENIAGYICHKLKNDLPDIVVSENEKVPTYSRVDHLREGGLSKPTKKTMQHMQELDQIFETNNGQGLLIRKDFLRFHIEQAHHIKCDEKVKSLFFRSRMYFKIRKLNQDLIDNTRSRKRKFTEIINVTK